MRRPAPTLLILAAGLGSRYGGLKQFEPMGPGGETLLDYSVFDAHRAGFERIVLVIRPDLAPQIKAELERRYQGHIALDFVVQDLHDVPEGFCVPAERSKPWGTLHAVLSARHAIQTPFAVINADDFYGPMAYRQVADFFGHSDAPSCGISHYCMIGYAVNHTLSANGGVNRGICDSRDGFLENVEELTGIVADSDDMCHGFRLDGTRVDISAHALASMNFWGFTPAIFAQMHSHFTEFLAEHGQRPGAECYIPSVVDRLIREQHADCRILHTTDHWFGVTYAQDRISSVARLSALISAGIYPERLWHGT